MLQNRMPVWVLLMSFGLGSVGYADLVDTLEEPEQGINEPSAGSSKPGPASKRKDKRSTDTGRPSSGEGPAARPPKNRAPAVIKPAGAVERTPEDQNREVGESEGASSEVQKEPATGRGERTGHSSEKGSDEKVSKNPQGREPVNFEGDELSGFRNLGVVELHNNVRVRQGDFYLQSRQAKVFLDLKTDDVKKVEAHGKVRMSKKDPKTGELIRATSEKVEFDALAEKVTLIGKATLHRGKDVINGEVIYYNLKTGWLKASKVKGVVQPEEEREQMTEPDQEAVPPEQEQKRKAGMPEEQTGN